MMQKTSKGGFFQNFTPKSVKKLKRGKNEKKSPSWNR